MTTTEARVIDFFDFWADELNRRSSDELLGSDLRDTLPIALAEHKPELLTLAADAIRELVTLKYSVVERYERMLGERMPAQVRQDSERRAQLLAAVETLEAVL
jgi:hypothetical protein